MKKKKRDISYFLTEEIHPAADNNLLYDSFSPNADEDDYKLYSSIKEIGIREPLQVSADGVLLSGHRRFAAALWLGLEKVPVIVAKDIRFNELSADERLSVLAAYNKQRDKSHAERLREAMLEINPDDVHQRLLEDRVNRGKVNIEKNVFLGDAKKRARITTRMFLSAAIKVIESEKEFWPLTDRRVHYLLLNKPPLRHDKKPGSIYQNDRYSYKALTNLLLRARLTGEIPMSALEDELRPIVVWRTHQNAADYIQAETEDFLRHYARDLTRGQANHIEILVEKNAIRKHVEKVAAEYCIPCTTGRGYSSLPPRYKMVKRFRASGKERLVLLILSDFDPDGEEIAASFPRSLRDDFKLSNVTCHKVALTGDDVREYNLPSNMEAKVTSPNYKKFVARHGVHVAELDACPVDLLQNKLRDAIESCLDMDLFHRELEQEKEDAAYVAATKTAVVKVMRQG